MRACMHGVPPTWNCHRAFLLRAHRRLLSFINSSLHTSYPFQLLLSHWPHGTSISSNFILPEFGHPKKGLNQLKSFAQALDQHLKFLWTWLVHLHLPTVMGLCWAYIMCMHLAKFRKSENPKFRKWLVRKLFLRNSKWALFFVAPVCGK